MTDGNGGVRELGDVHKASSEPEDALEWYDRAIDVLEESGHQRTI